MCTICWTTTCMFSAPSRSTLSFSSSLFLCIKEKQITYYCNWSLDLKPSLDFNSPLWIYVTTNTITLLHNHLHTLQQCLCACCITHCLLFFFFSFITSWDSFTCCASSKSSSFLFTSFYTDIYTYNTIIVPVEPMDTCSLKAAIHIAIWSHTI